MTADESHLLRLAQADIFVMGNDGGTSDIADIIEVTYQYKDLENGRWYNSTVFEGFGGYTSDTPIHEAYTGTENKLQDRIHVINTHIQTLSAYARLSARGILFVSSLGYIRDVLEMARLGLIFEAEKAGYKHAHDDVWRRARTQEVQALDAKLFGGLVSTNKQECADIRQRMNSELLRKKDMISNTDAIKMRGCFDIKDTPATYTKQPQGPDILNKQITREVYMQIFEDVLDIYNIDTSVQLSETIGSIYDGEDALYIPNSKEYTHLSIKRVIELIAHEIETHYIIQANNSRTLRTFRGAGNLPREEGLAIVMERIVGGHPMDTIEMSLNFTRNYIGELYSGQDFREFIRFYDQVFDISGVDLDQQFLRHKRNYPSDLPGVQHKDTVYTRGIHQVVQYLQDPLRDPKDLYVGKVSFEDMPAACLLAKQEGSTLQYPYFIAEILMYVLTSGDQQVTREGFLVHFFKKYPFLQRYRDSFEAFPKTIEERIKKIIILFQK